MKYQKRVQTLGPKPSPGPPSATTYVLGQVTSLDWGQQKTLQLSVVNNTLAHPRKPSRTVQVHVNHDYCHVALLQQYQTRWTVITRLIITGVPKYLPPQDCEQPF